MFPFFSGLLILAWLEDGRLVRVYQDWSYTALDGTVYTVRAGFVTDGASIPRVLWSGIGSPYIGLYRWGAVLHDWLYRVLGVPKDRADAVFRECMLRCGCSDLLVDAIFEGVHLGGLDAYTQDQKAAAAALTP